MSKNIDQLNKKGFFVANLLNKSDVKKILEEIKKIYFFNKKNSSLDKHISILYKKDPILAGKCYDSLNQSAVIQKIFLSNKVLNNVAKYLGLKTKSLITFADFQFLVMLPKKKTEHLGWHQDSRYFEFTKNKRSSLILWTSIGSQGKKINSSLSIMPGSHNLGRIMHEKNKIKKIKKTKKIKRGRFYINLDQLKKFKAENYFISSGQSLVFDSNLVHRTGPSTKGNNSIRYTMIARYKNINKILNS